MLYVYLHDIKKNQYYTVNNIQGQYEFNLNVLNTSPTHNTNFFF